MPRAEKKPRQHKYNRQYLEALPRKRLQALAKQEGIRANLKSEEIIDQIIQSRSSQQFSEDEQTNSQIRSLASATEDKAPDVISQRNSSRQDEDGEEVLSLGNIRDARRLITQINNNLTCSGGDLNDMREILTHAKAEMTKAQGMVKDMIEVRIEFEESIVKRLHSDQHLWDGTGLMPARHRVRWREFVKSERKIAKKRARTEERQQESSVGGRSEFAAAES